MKIIVMGAGVVGIAAAYFLAKDGHEVTVVERQAQAAEETSWGNAGLIAPGHAYAWSSPRAPKILLKSLWRNDQALRLKLSADPRMWTWMISFLGQCNSARAELNTQRKATLCLYSQSKLHEIREDLKIDYHQRTQGCLYLYRSQESFERAAANTKVLTDLGQTLELIDPGRAAELEPALAPNKDKFAGGLYAPGDESGECPVFTRALAKHLKEEMGVTFHYETEITAIRTEGERIAGVLTSAGEMTADGYILSLGPYSPILARKIGIKIPVYPVKGYSCTLPVPKGSNTSPTMGGVDEDNLLAFSRLGDKLRLTATAEFSGYDRTCKPSDFRVMLAKAKDLFPEGGDYSQPDYWAGLRPMTPQLSP